MKTIQFIIRTLMVLMLTVVTEYTYAASLTHELGSNVTVAWYNDQDKTSGITEVTLTDSQQTIYVDIAPAEGYWTDIGHLNGVEKIASLIHAGAPMKRSPSYSGLGAISTIDGENYAANGAGLYQVTVPALADGQTDSQIAEICLIGTIVESTDLSGATITASSATYTGDVQTASGITVTLGETELTEGTHYTVTTNAGETNVGNYAVGITGMGHYKGTATNDNAFKITKAALTVTANANSITYGDAPANDGVTYSGFVGTEDESVLTGTLGYTYSYTQYGDVGNYTITPSGLTSSNYDITFATGTLTVEQREVTLSWSDTELTYNRSAQKPTATAGNLVNSDECTVTVSGEQTNVGTGYTATASALSNTNYKLPSSVTQTFSISAKTLTITADAKSKTYGEDDPTLTYTSSGLVDGDNITGSLSRASGENVGTYAINQGTLTAGNNYSISYTGANFTISKAALTVTAKPKTINYGDAPANDGVTYSGFVNSETKSVLGGTLTYAYTYSRYGNVGNYNITPSGLTSGNYDITFATGTLTVQKKTVGLNWGNTSFTYNGSEQKPTATATGLVNSDVIGVTVTGGQTNVGNYTATASALTGTKSGNYKLPAARTVSFSISPNIIEEDTDGTEVTQDEHGYTVNVTETTSNTAAEIIDLPNNATVYNLTYSRELSSPTGDGDTKINDVATNLYTTCLPYAPTPTDYLKFYELTGVSGSTLLFGEVENPTENTPYLVAVSGDHNITLAPDAISGLSLRKVIEGNSVDGGYTMMGTHTGLSNSDARSVVGERDCFILQINNKWGKVVEGSVYIPPFRAFIKGPAVVNGAPLTGNFDGEATGIDSLRLVNHDGTDQWYDLNGRLIERPVKKGLYIHKGNKISIK